MKLQYDLQLFYFWDFWRYRKMKENCDPRLNTDHPFGGST